MQHKAVSPRQQMLWEGLWTLYGSQDHPGLLGCRRERPA